MKKIIKYLLHSVGYGIHPISPPGSCQRPIGYFESFLEDIRARGFEASFILDAGAHAGDWSRMAKRIFPEASFLLIEPQPEMRRALNSLCAEFGDISWVEAGVGARQGRLAQTIWDDLAGSSFLPEVREDLLRSGRQREVDVITIDSLLASRGSQLPELIKLDIQGFELEALKGAQSLFGKTELFIMEVSLFSFMRGMPLFRDVLDFMGERGYEVYDIPGYLRRPYDGALGQLDVAFARREGLLRRSDKW